MMGSTDAEPVGESFVKGSRSQQSGIGSHRGQACFSSSRSSPQLADRRFDAVRYPPASILPGQCFVMSSTIASLQTWVSETLVESFGLVYVVIGALVGVAHGSVHGVQTLAPRLTSVHGIKQLVGGEKAAHGGALTGEPCPPVTRASPAPDTCGCCCHLHALP